MAGFVEGLAGLCLGVEVLAGAAALLAHQFQDPLSGQFPVEFAGTLLVAHLLDGEEEGVGGVDRQGVDQGIAGERHHGRVQGPVPQAGAGAEEADGQDQQGEGRAQMPAREAQVPHQAPAQPPAAPQGQQAEHQGQQQFALAARPQHGEHLLRVDEVFDIEAIGAHPVFGDEGGGGDLEEEHQPEPQGQPDPDKLQPGAAQGMGAGQQQGEDGGDAPQPAEGGKVDPDTLQQQLRPTGDGVDPLLLPEPQACPAGGEGDERDHRKNGDGPKWTQPMSYFCHCFS
ncbi:hypothetical protein D3C85_1034940 [compost metagenome]